MKLLCPCCEEFNAKLSDPFTESMWNTLLEVDEISPNLYKKAICRTCFQELREALIEHT